MSPSHTDGETEAHGGEVVRTQDRAEGKWHSGPSVHGHVHMAEISGTCPKPVLRSTAVQNKPFCRDCVFHLSSETHPHCAVQAVGVPRTFLGTTSPQNPGQT